MRKTYDLEAVTEIDGIGYRMVSQVEDATFTKISEGFINALWGDILDSVAEICKSYRTDILHDLFSFRRAVEQMDAAHDGADEEVERPIYRVGLYPCGVLGSSSYPYPSYVLRQYVFIGSYTPGSSTPAMITVYREVEKERPKDTVTYELRSIDAVQYDDEGWVWNSSMPIGEIEVPMSVYEGEDQAFYRYMNGRIGDIISGYKPNDHRFESFNEADYEICLSLETSDLYRPVLALLKTGG